MNDYQKKLDALLRELKILKHESNLLKQENNKCNKKLMDSYTRIEDLHIKNTFVTKENASLKKEVLQLKKFIKQKERFFNNRIKKNIYFDNRKSCKNKIENVLRHECKELKVTLGAYEQFIENIGENLGFDGILVNELLGVVDDINDVGIKKMLSNIIERNKRQDA